MRVNKRVNRPAVLEPIPLTTHEGAPAKHIDAVSQLRRLTLACMLWEGTFYVDGVEAVKAIDCAVEKVLALKNGPQIVSDLANEIRTQGKLRHTPLYLALSLVKAGSKKTKRAESCRAVVADTLSKIIQRPDELAEFVALYFKDGRKMLTNQTKKGLTKAFKKFNEYSLSKYANREGAVKLRDVLFLIHPKPDNKLQQKLWDKLANKELTAPETWERELSAGKDKKATFTSLLKENKLGALALLRNLRNMEEAGVDRGLIRTGLKNMDTERVLPFRFISAAKYAPSLEPDLEEAMIRSLSSLKKLPGKTILMVDNSGSMSDPVSSKSEITRSEAAIALAILLREICEDSEVVVFSDDAVRAPSRRGFALREAIRRATRMGGTYTEKGKKLADKLGYDRLIIFTDEQSHTSLSEPKGKGYVINVSNTQNGIGYGKWVHLDGFSESCVDFIQEYEQVGC